MACWKPGDEDFCPKEPCSFCGEDHISAYWSGHKNVFVCRKCAEVVLPKLIVDTFLAWLRCASKDMKKKGFLMAHGLIKGVNSSFWEAMADGFLRIHERENDDEAIPDGLGID